MIPSLEGMEPVDYARYITITVGFLVASFSPQKVFLRSDVVCCVGMGAGWLLFPDIFLDFQVSGPRSQAHVVYGRFLGMSFLLFALPILLNKRTRDDKVFTSLYLSRFLGFTTMLISLLYCHWKFSASEVRLTAKQFWFTGLSVAGWMLGNLRHLLVSGGAHNSRERNAEDRLRYHQFCDSLLCIMSTLFIIAYPTMSFADLNIKVSPNDGFLAFVHCSQAALGIADGLYALTAHGFDDSEAVKNVFKFRIWSVVAYCAMQAFCGLFKPEFIGVMLVTCGALLTNSLLALRYISQKAASGK